MHPYLRKHSIEMPIQKLPPRYPATSLLHESPKSNVANTHRLYQKPTPDRHARLCSERSEDTLHVHHLKARSVPQFCCQAVGPPRDRYLGTPNRPLNTLRRQCLLLPSFFRKVNETLFGKLYQVPYLGVPMQRRTEHEYFSHLYPSRIWYSNFLCPKALPPSWLNP